jgi:SAM-dependent methyltransferase
MTEHVDVREMVRDRYGAIAEADGGCCGGCGCGDSDDTVALGYTEEQSKAIPKGSNLGLGCGNPLGHAAVKRGEVVLDLGSGAGIDVFLASQEVGPEGRAIGVDMTPAMLSRARRNAVDGGYTNVEFRLGEIENLPVADGSVDLIISNCVINLSPSKTRVFAEALRALRPGGRMVVSDLVLTRPLPDAVRKSAEAYVGCIAGAMLRDDYLAEMRAAGFANVEVIEERSYAPGGTGSDVVTEAGAWDAVRSMKVRGLKPRG